MMLRCMKLYTGPSSWSVDDRKIGDPTSVLVEILGARADTKSHRAQETSKIGFLESYALSSYQNTQPFFAFGPDGPNVKHMAFIIEGSHHCYIMLNERLNETENGRGTIEMWRR